MFTIILHATSQRDASKSTVVNELLTTFTVMVLLGSLVSKLRCDRSVTMLSGVAGRLVHVLYGM